MLGRPPRWRHQVHLLTRRMKTKMPQLTEEDKKVLQRLKALISNDQIVMVMCDDGTKVMAEIWADGDDVAIYPMLKVLTDEEKTTLKLKGDVPC